MEADGLVKFSINPRFFIRITQNQVLSNNNCLKKRVDFSRAFKSGLKYKEDFLSLRLIENNKKNSRFGFVISQKVSKKATTRNKIKRRLRAMIRMRLPKIKNGFDMVFLANPGLEKKDFWELEEILDTLFKKANLFKN